MRSRIVLTGLALSFAFACGGESDSAKPNAPATATPVPSGSSTAGIVNHEGPVPLVMISIDTLRADRLPAYGYQGVETPAIDRLRSNAILFERAYAHAPLTLPSHVSLMTGQLPGTNGVRDNARYRLAKGYQPYLPLLLKRHGYQTGAAVSTFVLRSTSGFAQGFDFFDDATKDTGSSLEMEAERPGTDTLAAALPWLRQAAAPAQGGDTAGLFFFLHLYEPHLPYQAPAPFAERYGNSYESEIAAADAVVGRLLTELETLGLYDRALIVLLSDHGEGLGEHGEKSHGVMLYRESIHVPLLVKLPGNRRAGASVASPVQLIDVLPTLTDVLALPTPPGLQGRSLLLEDVQAERPLFAETLYPWLHYGWSDLASVIAGRFHYIHGPEPELFDMVADPAERHNILTDNRRTFRTLESEALARRQPVVAPTNDEDSETLRKLAALGYLSNAAPVPADGPLQDPRRELVAATAMLDEAFSYLRTQNHVAAVTAFRTLLDRYPDMVDAWASLGASLLQLERFDEAFEALAQTLTLTDGSPQAALLAGRALLGLQRFDEAREHARIALTSKPVEANEFLAEVALVEGDLGGASQALAQATLEGSPNPQLRQRLGLALSADGRHSEALPLLDALAREHPEPPALVALATALVAAGQPAQATAVVGQLDRIDPNNPGGQEIRGLLALQGGRIDEARGYLEQSVATTPSRANAWNLLAVAHFQLQDVAGAIDAWRQAVTHDPQHFDALYNLAFTATRAGQTDLGRDTLRRYIATAPPARFAREIQEAQTLLGQIGE